jgi:hypothetical protein
MVDRIIRTRTQRLAVLAFVVALHLLAIVLVMLVRGATMQAPTPPVGAPLSVQLIKAEAKAPSPPPPQTLPSKIVKLVRPMVKAPPAVETTAAATAPGAGGCSTLQTVSAAMLADPDVLAAVHASPPETRSIADAIMLWNAQWVDAAPAQDGPLTVVRSSIETSLRAVDPICLEEKLVGPRLIPIPAGELTTFLVIGSGEWTWQDLLLAQPPVPPGVVVPGGVDPAAAAVPGASPPRAPIG